MTAGIEPGLLSAVTALAVVLASIVYRLVITVALQTGLDPSDMTPISAVLVVAALVVPQPRFCRRRRERHAANEAARLVDDSTDAPATTKAGACAVPTVDDVHKTFFPGTVDERGAPAGVSPTPQKGGFVTVIGSNGAGRSTSRNAVSGTPVPDTGTVRVDDTEVLRCPSTSPPDISPACSRTPGGGRRRPRRGSRAWRSRSGAVSPAASCPVCSGGSAGCSRGRARTCSTALRCSGAKAEDGP